MKDPTFIGRSYIVSFDPHEGVDPVITLTTDCPHCGQSREADAYDYRCVMCANPRADAVPLDEHKSALLVWEDIFFAAHVVGAYYNDVGDGPEPSQLQFHVYRIVGVDDTGPTYEEAANYSGSSSVTLDRAQARVFAEGNIKWDGCSNVNFQPTHPNTHEHFCSRDGLKAWATVADRLFDTLAALRTHNSDLA
jgi:hypothetical protein